MLPKKNRANKKTVEKIFKTGKVFNSLNLTLKFVKNESNTPHISFIVPKNVAKLAVKRNLLRRKGYIAIKKYFNVLPRGFSSVFIFRKYQDNISILENEIKNLLIKIN